LSSRERSTISRRTTIRTTSTISAASRSLTRSSFSNMTTTTSRYSTAPKIQVTPKKQHASSRSCSRTNIEDAVFLWGAGRQSVRISRRNRSRVPLRRSADHRRAARGSRTISRVLACRHEGRQEGDFHRRIQGIRCSRLPRGSARGVSGFPCGPAGKRRGAIWRMGIIAIGLTLSPRYFSHYFFLGGVAIFASEGADAATFGFSFFGFLVSRLLRT
jgi:hypothetical protein